MRGKLTYRQSQYLTCFKRPNATLTCKVQHTNHFLRRRMCSSIHTSGEFGIALIKSMARVSAVSSASLRCLRDRMC